MYVKRTSVAAGPVLIDRRGEGIKI